MLIIEPLNELEKAFVSYVESCVSGRALRMRKKFKIISEREKQS